MAQRLSDLYIILFFIYNFSRQMQTLMYMVPVKTLYIRENFLKNFNTLSKLSLSMLESSIRCIRRLGTTRNEMCTKTNYSISVNLQTGLLRIHFTFIYCLLNSVQKLLFGLTNETVRLDGSAYYECNSFIVSLEISIVGQKMKIHLQ